MDEIIHVQAITLIPAEDIAILHLHVGLEEFTDCGLPQWHCNLNLVICRRTGTIRITSSDSDANK